MPSATHWRWCRFEQLSTSDLYAVIALREAVFVVEQRCAYLDCDGLDPQAMHLLGERDGALVAYLRALSPGVVYPEATAIGRVVVAPSARRTGLGAALMQEGIRRTGPAAPIKISAQAHLEDWYRRLGFETCGAGYLEDEILHVPMRLIPASG